MKKRLTPIFFSLCGLVILGIVIFSLHDNVEPSATVTRITEDEYLTAHNQYSKNPIMNGKETPIPVPSGEALSYFKATICDKGYNKSLPINVEIFFAADETLTYIEESSFIVTDPKDLSVSGWKYLNTILFAEEYGGLENSVILILTVDTVYNGIISDEFYYNTSIVLDLHKAEVIRFST